MTASVINIGASHIHCVAHLYGGLAQDIPGTWWKIDDGGKVLFKCPGGHTMHLIAKVIRKGITTKRVRCQAKGCKFAARLRLEDWPALIQ